MLSNTMEQVLYGVGFQGGGGGGKEGDIDIQG